MKPHIHHQKMQFQLCVPSVCLCPWPVTQSSEFCGRRNVNQYVALVSFGAYFVRGLSICTSSTDITLVILYYDHALTLPAEIQRFWMRDLLTWPTILFLVNRYLAFFGHFPVILQSFWNSSDLPHKFTVGMLPYRTMCNEFLHRRQSSHLTKP